MTVAFISLGSNIQPEKNLLEAINLLSRHVKILRISTVYLTEPLLHRSQPKYYNCVIKIETDIEPIKLKFDVLRAIEAELSRKRTDDKYAPRTIDLDLLIYGDLHLETENLVVPDPEIFERAFLALALYEIEPDLVLPASNKPIRELAAKFKNRRIKKLSEFTFVLQNLAGSLGQ